MVCFKVINFVVPVFLLILEPIVIAKSSIVLDVKPVSANFLCIKISKLLYGFQWDDETGKSDYNNSSFV